MRTIHNNILNMLFIMAVVSGLVACSNKPHEGERGLAIALLWQDDADKGTSIDDLRLWIYKENGEPVDEYCYDNARDIASRFYGLPAGDYVLVAAANVVAPLTVEEAVAGGVKPYGGLLLSLADASSSPAHAHYGVMEVTVQGKEVEQTCISLRRVLAEMAVTIEGVPEGARFSVVVEDAATALSPACNMRT